MNPGAGNKNLDWQPRRMGKEKPILPAGSRVKRLDLETHTHVEYGEKTWTTGQTVRDILQNHLDAQTQIFFDEIVTKVIDVEELEKQEMTAERIARIQDFAYRLYMYKLGQGDRTPDAEHDTIHALVLSSKCVPIRREMRSEFDGELKYSQLQKVLAAVKEKPLDISYLVFDQTNPDDKGEWVSKDELISRLRYKEGLPITHEYKPEIGTAGFNFRYKISGINIKDSGGGFDNTLTAFYKSTKTGKRHLRGKFGEGDKMSRTHLVRHGATSRSRSNYHINSGQNKERFWQHHPYVDPLDNLVKLKGVEIEIPSSTPNNIGSSTRIDVRKADPKFASDFAQQTDPRVPNAGLAANCLEFSSAKYYYPGVVGEKESELPKVGVSLEADPKLQYVQGLYVGMEPDSNSLVQRRMLFSYNFLDSSVIKGRDRNQMDQVILEHVINFWNHAESRELIAEFLRRVLLDNPPKKYEYVPSFEGDVLGSLFRRGVIYDHQTQRVVDLFHELFKEVMNLEDGNKYVFVNNSDNTGETKRAIPILEQKGYKIIKVQKYLSNSVLTSVARYHKNSFELHTMDSMKTEIELWDLSEGLKPEQIESIKPLFANALVEFKKILAWLNIEGIEINETPFFATSKNPSYENPVEAEFLQGEKRFRINIKPGVIFSSEVGEFNPEYWQDRLVVEMMATIGRTDGFEQRIGAMQNAQGYAQQLLEQSALNKNASLDQLLELFTYTEGDDRKYRDRFFEQLLNIREEMLAWQTLDRLRSNNLTLAELENAVTAFPSLPARYKNKVESLIAQTIVIQDGIVGYCNRVMGGNSRYNYSFQAAPLSVLETVGEVAGNVLYRLGDNSQRFFIMQTLPEGAVVSKGGLTHVVFDDKILSFTKKSLEFYDPPLYDDVVINGQCLSINSWEYPNNGSELSLEQKKSIIQKFSESLNKILITLPDNGNLRPMKSLEGMVKTPLPIDYGKHEWSNPVRVFQDIVQNHLDASPDRQVELRYEVQRNGSRIWVDGGSITTDDTIVGFRVLDNGSGYAPDYLGAMGKSSKKSPLFAGKYGEGQKMVAAAAARQGLDLTFSSIAIHKGEKYQWQGKVGTEDQELIIEGKPTVDKRVIFNITSKEVVQSEEVSATTIRLPENMDLSQNQEWQRWVNVVDPRMRDEFGNGGLSRYILNLRKADHDQVIDMGYMRILLGEPGAVYENGLLVKKDNSLAFGYDVPEVVSTRERNAVDSERLKGYIVHALSSCHDPRYVSSVIRAFKDKHLTKGVKNFDRLADFEVDLDFGDLGLNSDLESGPYLKQACQRELPGVVVSSREFYDECINNLRYRAQTRLSADDAKALVKWQSALDELRFIPEDRLLDVNRDRYFDMSRIFPSAEAVAESISTQGVDVDPEISTRLRSLIVERARNLSLLVENLSTQPVFTNLLIGSEKSVPLYVANSSRASLERQRKFWTDRTSLQASPDSIFVAPASAGYLGVATLNRLGINEALFTNERIRRLTGVVDHELVHKFFGLGDYTPEFIITLLKLAKYNLETA